VLYTSLPLKTFEQAWDVIAIYESRWLVKIFFKTLKSDYKVQRRLFEKLPRTLNCLAVYSIIAWRVMDLCHLGRERPDRDCEVVFSPSEGSPSIASSVTNLFPRRLPD